MCRMLHDNCHILCYDGSKKKKKPKNLISILWLKDIEMSVAEVGLGTVIMLEV